MMLFDKVDKVKPCSITSDLLENPRLCLYYFYISVQLNCKKARDCWRTNYGGNLAMLKWSMLCHGSLCGAIVKVFWFNKINFNQMLVVVVWNSKILVPVSLKVKSHKKSRWVDCPINLCSCKLLMQPQGRLSKHVYCQELSDWSVY